MDFNIEVRNVCPRSGSTTQLITSNIIIENLTLHSNNNYFVSPQIVVAQTVPGDIPTLTATFGGTVLPP